MCLIQKSNSLLNSFTIWANSNKLTINTDKTYYLTITNRQIPENLPPIKLSDTPLQSSSNLKFLGVLLDEGLGFGGHTRYTCAKISKSLGIFYKLRNFLPLKSLISLYYTFIYPYFVYCNIVWCNTFSTHLIPLEMLQRKALRIINRSAYNSHTNVLFYNNKILKLRDLNFYFQSIFMYNSNTSDFHSNHTHNTRHSRSNLVPVFQRTTRTQQSLSYSGPKIWNQIPIEIRLLPTVHQFKKKLKDYLVEKYSNST